TCCAFLRITRNQLDNPFTTWVLAIRARLFTARDFTVVVVRIRRPLGLLHGFLLQFLLQPVYGFVELEITALTPGFGVKFDLDVRIDAVILNFPLSFRVIEGKMRRSYGATVNQRRISTDAYQSSPGTLSDQGSHAGAAKHPRH